MSTINADLFASVTPGAAFDSPAAVTAWVLFAFTQANYGHPGRLVAAHACQAHRTDALPPLFRWLARASLMRLPHRRHYSLATEYSRGPPHTLRAVPSMIDLDLAMVEVVDEAGGVTSGREGRSAAAVKCRYSPSGYAQEKAVVFEASEGGALEDDEVKHYDADGGCTSGNVWAGYVSNMFALSFLTVSVLTKVVVYAGIGTIDCYHACDVRGARVGCLIFTLLLSMLGIELRAFRGETRKVCVRVLSLW